MSPERGRRRSVWRSTLSQSCYPARSATTAGVPHAVSRVPSVVPVLDAERCSPALLDDGRLRVTSDEEVFFGTSIPAVHPRTAAGITADGALILMVVDGRQDESRGVSLEELAVLMRDAGAADALNLDGGGSSTLVVDGILINRPAGYQVEREVMSAVAVFCEP